MSRVLCFVNLFLFSFTLSASENLHLSCVRNVNSQLELKIQVHEGLLHLMFVKGADSTLEPLQRAFMSSEQIYNNFIHFDLEDGKAHLMLNSALLKKEIPSGLLFFGENYEKSFSCSME